MFIITNCILTGYVIVSLVLWVLARFSPYEWDNPYPCIEEPEEVTYITALNTVDSQFNDSRFNDNVLNKGSQFNDMDPVYQLSIYSI